MTPAITEHDVTVVVCTYNGESKIAACLGALSAQSKAVKTIVINDGSQDRTAEIVIEAGVPLVSIPTNGGIAEARERALTAVTTSHIAFTDDDCIPAVDWVESLINAWNSAPDGTTAVGGSVSVMNPESYVERFLEECNPLRPIEMYWSHDAGLLGRVKYYLKANGEGRTHGRHVVSMPTANFVCQRESAIQAGGFRSSNGVRGGEDERLCARLRATFGESTLWFDPSVTVAHRFEQTLSGFVKRAYKQGRNSGQRWIVEKGIPSLPPMACLVLLSSVLVGMWTPRLFWVPAVLLPPLIHSRWTVSAFLSGKISRLGFAFLLLGQELIKLGSFALGLLTSMKAVRSSR